jgi:hypothetical protein
LEFGVQRLNVDRCTRWIAQQAELQAADHGQQSSVYGALWIDGSESIATFEQLVGE